MSTALSHFILDGLHQGLRNDSRTLTAFRGFSLLFHPIPQANSSVRVLRSDLDITIGIKCELSDTPEIKLCIEQFPHIEALLREFMIRKAPLESLGTSWTVAIDVLVSKSNGSLIDAVAVGIYAALAKLRLPACSAYIDEGKKKIIMHEKNQVSIDVKGIPLVLSLGLVEGGVLFVDPDLCEEELLAAGSSGSLIVVVGGEGGVEGVRKVGLGSVDVEFVGGVVDVAGKLLGRLKNEVDGKIESVLTE
jgi:exosome complex RNA-binding protein Rrp42 (RNase PH superfamily)